MVALMDDRLGLLLGESSVALTVETSAASWDATMVAMKVEMMAESKVGCLASSPVER